MTNVTSTRSMRPGRRPVKLRRRGIATVELAVCLPMLALLVFGSIQACNLVFLKHAITSAAYEGTLELARSSATNESVTIRVEQILNMHGVRDYEVDLLPQGTDLTRTETGTPIQIRVRAKVDSNLALKGWFPMAEEVEYVVAGPR